MAKKSKQVMRFNGRVTFRCAEAFHNQIKLAAEATHMKDSEFMRAAIREKIQRHCPAPRNGGLKS